MTALPTVVATGNTVTLLHHEYRIEYPDGTTEELIPAACKRDAVDEYAWVMRRAQAEWRRRRRCSRT